jgi:ferredoxin
MSQTAVFQVKITNTGQIIDCPTNRTVLQSALAAGIDYPYACATGNCGMCVSDLTAGDVHLLPHGDGSLSRAQKEAGQTLACRAQPRADLAIKWRNRSQMTRHRPG